MARYLMGSLLVCRYPEVVSPMPGSEMGAACLDRSQPHNASFFFGLLDMEFRSGGGGLATKTLL